MTGFLTATAVSFAVILVAELGDKSQLMALTFATRFWALPVLLGITAATAVVHAVSVGVGHLLGAADGLAIVAGRALGRNVPERFIRIGATVLFFAFGAWLGVEALLVP